MVMVALVIAFPITVTGLLDKPSNVDLSKIKIELPLPDAMIFLRRIYRLRRLRNRKRASPSISDCYRQSLHSIMASARARNVAGRVKPIAFAVLRFITNSNLVGCSTGSSAGLAPFRILSTRTAAARYISASTAK
jgi:hypothetical protein